MPTNEIGNMDEIYLTPLLPYKEFLVTHGRHGAEMMKGGKLGNHYHARYKFPCGTEVSVISGPLFYCDRDRPYEYRVNEEEPVGHQTDEELYILLTKILAGDIQPQSGKATLAHPALAAVNHRERDPLAHLADDTVHGKQATAQTTNPHAPSAKWKKSVTDVCHPNWVGWTDDEFHPK